MNIPLLIAILIVALVGAVAWWRGWLRALSRIFWGSDIPDPVVDPWQVSAADLTDEERFLRLEAAHLTTLRERARIIRLQRSQFWAVVALCVALIAIGFLFGRHLQRAQDQIKTTQRTAQLALARSERRHQALRAYQIASCKRGNETRVSDNRAHLQNFEFDTELIVLIKTLAGEPQLPNPLLTTTQQQTNARLGAKLLANLERGTERLEWRHLIENCIEAVDDPAKYTVPPSQPFTFVDRRGRRHVHLPPYGVLHIIDNPKTGQIE